MTKSQSVRASLLSRGKALKNRREIKRKIQKQMDSRNDHQLCLNFIPN